MNEPQKQEQFPWEQPSETYTQAAPAAPEPWAPKPPVTWQDGVFSMVFLALAYLYWEELIFTWNRFGFTIVTGCFLGTSVLYLYTSGCRPKGESWFWFGITAVLGAAFSLPYGGNVLGIMHILALHLTAMYWVLSATGSLSQGGRSSNWLPLDLLNMAIVIPFSNFGKQPVNFFRYPVQEIKKLRQRPKPTKHRMRWLWPVLFGIAAAFLAAAMVLPQLLRADAGFAQLYHSIFDGISAWFGNLGSGFGQFGKKFFQFLIRLPLTVPTAMFLYGLLYGSIHKDQTKRCETAAAGAAMKKIRVAPMVTVSLPLILLLVIYLVFIGLQANYLFSAFWGSLPEEFSYAEYARQGFFELCRVSAINLGLLLLFNSISRKKFREHWLLRVCNLALSVLTLLLVATAGAKMAMYIQAYGLTVKRILSSVFLLWLALVYLGVIAAQFRRIPLVAGALIVGAVLFALLSVVPLEDGIGAYNRAHGKDPELTEQKATVSCRREF